MKLSRTAGLLYSAINVVLLEVVDSSTAPIPRACSTLSYKSENMVPERGIEPPSTDYETVVLPLYYAGDIGLMPPLRNQSSISILKGIRIPWANHCISVLVLKVHNTKRIAMMPLFELNSCVLCKRVKKYSAGVHPSKNK